MWPCGQVFTVAALQICGGISELGWTWSNNMQGNYVHMSYSCPYLSMPANQALGRPKKRAGNLGIVVWWVHTIQSEAKTWQSMTVSNEILTLHKDWIEKQWVTVININLILEQPDVVHAWHKQTVNSWQRAVHGKYAKIPGAVIFGSKINTL